MNKDLLASYTTKHHIASDINRSYKTYMGFELELVESSSDIITDDQFEDLLESSVELGLLAKYDGSVDAELVSCPLQIEEFKQLLKNTVDMVKDNSSEWLSWDNFRGRCGFHIHVNRNSIKSVKRLYAFVNNNNQVLRLLSGRKNTHYCSFDWWELKRNYKKTGTRYTALNNLNKHTVEFRFWRGSLFLPRLCMYADLTYTMCRYSHLLGDTTNDLSFPEIVFLTNNAFLNDLITAKRDLCTRFELTFRFLRFTGRILKYTRFKGYKRNLKFLKELQKTLSKKHDDRLSKLDQYNYFLTCNF